MRIVGTKNRCEIELDPVKAYRRARSLDAMLRSATPLNLLARFRDEGV